MTLGFGKIRTSNVPHGSRISIKWSGRVAAKRERHRAIAVNVKDRSHSPNVASLLLFLLRRPPWLFSGVPLPVFWACRPLRVSFSITKKAGTHFLFDGNENILCMFRYPDFYNWAKRELTCETIPIHKYWNCWVASALKEIRTGLMLRCVYSIMSWELNAQHIKRDTCRRKIVEPTITKRSTNVNNTMQITNDCMAGRRTAIVWQMKHTFRLPSAAHSTNSLKRSCEDHANTCFCGRNIQLFALTSALSSSVRLLASTIRIPDWIFTMLFRRVLYSCRARKPRQ